MTDLDQQINDAIACGKLTAHDAHIVQTYRQFLSELHLRRTDRQAWRQKWAAYAGGLVEGPTTPEEFEEIRARRAAERGSQ